MGVAIIFEMLFSHFWLLIVQRSKNHLPLMIYLSTDLLIKSKSGTGKTLVFCTIALERYDASVQAPQSLIIVPTREVALQIESYLNVIGGSCKGWYFFYYFFILAFVSSDAS